MKRWIVLAVTLIALVAYAANEFGDTWFQGIINFQNPATPSISSGAISILTTYQLVDTEGDIASDDLDTINGGTAGDVLILRAFHPDRTVVIKHGTGNIVLDSGEDYSLDDDVKVVALQFNGTSWFVFTGPLGAGSLPSSVTLDSEWDTMAKINAASTDTDAVLDTDIGATVQAWDSDLDDYSGGTIAGTSLDLNGAAAISGDITFDAGGQTVISNTADNSIIFRSNGALFFSSDYNTGGDHDINFQDEGVTIAKIDTSLELFDIAKAEFGPTDAMTADVVADDIKIENNAGDAGLSLLSGGSGLGRIFFGTTGAVNSGSVQYDPSITTMYFYANSLAAFRINGGQDIITYDDVLPNSDLGGNLGAPSYRYTDGYIQNVTATNLQITSNSSSPEISFDTGGTSEFDILQVDESNFDIMSNRNIRFWIDQDDDDSSSSYTWWADGSSVMAMTLSASGLLDTVALELGPTDSVTADVDGDDLKIENTSGNAGINILSSTSGLSGIYFGDSADPDQGGIIYSNTGPTLTLAANTQNYISMGGSGGLSILANMVAGGGVNDIGAGGTPFDDVFFTNLEAVAGTFSGDLVASAMLNLDEDGTALTITSNAITISKSYHLVTSSVSPINNIYGGTEGDILILTATGYAPGVTIAHNSGSGTTNIWCDSSASITLAGNDPAGGDEAAILFKLSDQWLASELWD